MVDPLAVFGEDVPGAYAVVCSHQLWGNVVVDYANARVAVAEDEVTPVIISARVILVGALKLGVGRKAELRKHALEHRRRDDGTVSASAARLLGDGNGREARVSVGIVKPAVLADVFPHAVDENTRVNGNSIDVITVGIGISGACFGYGSCGRFVISV